MSTYDELVEREQQIASKSLRIEQLEGENSRLKYERNGLERELSDSRKIQAAEKGILLAEIEAHAQTKRDLAEERARLDAQEAQLPKGFEWYLCPLGSGGWLVSMIRLDGAVGARVTTYPAMRAAIDAARKDKLT